MIWDFDSRHRAVSSRDARFDGWFIVAVTSTGIYGRPSCPAVKPKEANVRFYPTAGAAQYAGFRAGKRCLPDAVPGSPEWDLRAEGWRPWRSYAVQHLWAGPGDAPAGTRELREETVA